MVDDVVQYFNPRSREGSDLAFGQKHVSHEHFNPRSREGSDGNGTGTKLYEEHFNPRSREGSDGIHDAPWLSDKVFQSTLP